MKFTIPFLLMALGLAPICASGASLIGIDPPSNLIVLAGGLEWVYAAPCAPGGCGTITLHHDFRLPTDPEWQASFSDIASLVAQFTAGGLKCASPYFSNEYDHCDLSDTQSGYIWDSPLAPDSAHRFNGASETFLVRGEGGAIPEPSTFLLLGGGLAVVFAIRARGSKRRARLTPAL